MLHFLVFINTFHNDLEGHIQVGMLKIFGAFIETWQHRERRLLASGPWITLFSSHPWMCPESGDVSCTPVRKS